MDRLDRIAAKSREPLATKADMDRGFAELKEVIARSLGSLEAAIRQLLEEQGIKWPT